MDSYKKTVNYLSNCNRADALANVYIFYGPDEEGKNRVASTFSNAILKHNDESFCPDKLVISPDENDNIVIERAREIKRFLSLSPLASRKVIIISKAERMQEAAQSTLLKVLEEAPTYSTIIIVAKTVDSVLPTIVSRAVKIPFWKISAGNKRSDGKNSDNFLKLLKGEIKDRYAITDKLLGKESPAAIFEEWICCLRDLIIKKLDDIDSPLGNYSLGEAAGLLSKMQAIHIKLTQTKLNPKYAFDELILALK